MFLAIVEQRLIHGNSISEEAEAMMISKLKQRCGYECVEHSVPNMTHVSSWDARSRRPMFQFDTDRMSRSDPTIFKCICVSIIG